MTPSGTFPEHKITTVAYPLTIFVYTIRFIQGKVSTVHIQSAITPTITIINSSYRSSHSKKGGCLIHWSKGLK